MANKPLMKPLKADWTKDVIILLHLLKLADEPWLNLDPSVCNFWPLEVNCQRLC